MRRFFRFIRNAPATIFVLLLMLVALRIFTPDANQTTADTSAKSAARAETATPEFTVSVDKKIRKDRV